MTRDELRQKCIEAMAKAVAMAGGEPWDEILQYIKNEYILESKAAFDALHGLVRVVPIEATEEMIEANGSFDRKIIKEIWRGTAVIGDLTRPGRNERD